MPTRLGPACSVLAAPCPTGRPRPDESQPLYGHRNRTGAHGRNPGRRRLAGWPLPWPLARQLGSSGNQGIHVPHSIGRTGGSKANDTAQPAAHAHRYGPYRRRELWFHRSDGGTIGHCTRCWLALRPSVCGPPIDRARRPARPICGLWSGTTHCCDCERGGRAVERTCVWDCPRVQRNKQEHSPRNSPAADPIRRDLTI